MDVSSNSGADGLTDSFRSSSGENIHAGDPDSGSPSILDLATAPLGSSSGTNAVPIHHHSHHSDHTHGQTTQSGESHHQQVDEECLALGCAGSRKFIAFQNSLPFYQSFAFENPGLPYPDEVPFVSHVIFFPSIPTRGPPRNNYV